MNKFLPFLAILTLALSQQVAQNETSTSVTVSPTDAKTTENTANGTEKSETPLDTKQESSSSATVLIVIIVLLVLFGVGAAIFFLKRKDIEVKQKLLKHPIDPKEV